MTLDRTVEALPVTAETVSDALAWHHTDGPGLLAGQTLWATSSALLDDQHEVALGGALMGRRILEPAESGTHELVTTLAERVSS